MTTETATAPTQDECVLAALSHISAFLPTIGIIAPIVIWVTQKEKSRYVYIQSLQAIVYHITMIIGFFIGMGCYMLSFLGNFLTIFSTASNNSPSPWLFAGIFFPFIVFGFIFLGWFVFIIYAIVAAVMTFQGRDFRYIIIGRQVEKFAKK
jgi:uncharacterized Tic20 family protein